MPQLTAREHGLMSNALRAIEVELSKPDLADPQTAINIRAIIAQLIEQMGPTLLQLLIAILLNQEPNQTK